MRLRIPQRLRGSIKTNAPAPLHTQGSVFDNERWGQRMGDDVADTQSVSNDLLAEFYIPATSSLFERRPRTLKHGDTFAGPHSPEGIFHQDTRFLSRFVLTIGGERPLLLSSTVQNNNAVLHVDLRNADLFDNDAVLLPKNTIHVSRAKFLLDSVCHERLAVRNYGDRRCRVSIALD